VDDVQQEQAARVRDGHGFFAALDQSGGSTPGALAEYGVGEDAWSSEEEMFDLVHRMRTRVVTDTAFDASRILAAILFEQTLDRDVEGLPTAAYLWERKGIVPFLKVDLGLADQADGVRLMKPITTLDRLLERAVEQPVLGTKMRSVVAEADAGGIAAIADQQFEYAARIAEAGLTPILEPEVSIDSPTKEAAEELLHEALATRLSAWSHEVPLLFKLTIPTRPELYADLAAEPRVLRVLALSGGYSRDEACERLAQSPSMTASFSRALLEGLSAEQSDAAFHQTLAHSVAQIAEASGGPGAAG
jgi:fructose-bisphosphate aldolase, class I